MGRPKLFTTFKVFGVLNGKRLSEKEMLQVASEHFSDIVETHGLPGGSYMEKYDETRLKGRVPVHHYKIISSSFSH